MIKTQDLDAFINNLKSIFNKSPEGMVISDMRQKDQPVIFCNDTFLGMTGYTKEEVIGKNCRFLQGGDTEQPGLYIIRSAIKSQQSCRVVLKNYRKDGRLFYNRLGLFPIEDENGQLRYYVGIQDDITNLIQNQKRIRSLKDDHKILVSELHHRVKNNLAVVSSLLDFEINDQSPKKALQKSRMRVKSMATVHELLYQQNGFARVDFGEFLHKVTDYYSDYQKPNQPKLNFTINADSISLNINQAIPLSIIVSELIHNIYKHAYPNQSHGEAWLSLSQRNSDTVVLEIADKGKGIADITQFEDSTHMGSIMVDTLIKQLEGNLYVKQHQNSGTFLQIEIQKSDYTGSAQSSPISMSAID